MKQTSPTETTRTLHHKDTARRLYEDAINGGRLDLLDELIAPDFEQPDGSYGPAAFRANVEALRAGFPDIRFTIEDVIAEADRVVVRWSWTATHAGTFRGIAPTHKRVTNTGIVIYAFRDGRITHNWLETDRLGALEQMGVRPAP